MLRANCRLALLRASPLAQYNASMATMRVTGHTFSLCLFCHGYRDMGVLQAQARLWREVMPHFDDGLHGLAIAAAPRLWSNARYCRITRQSQLPIQDGQFLIFLAHYWIRGRNAAHPSLASTYNRFAPMAHIPASDDCQHGCHRSFGRLWPFLRCRRVATLMLEASGGAHAASHKHVSRRIPLIRAMRYPYEMRERIYCCARTIIMLIGCRKQRPLHALRHGMHYMRDDEWRDGEARAMHAAVRYQRLIPAMLFIYAHEKCSTLISAQSLAWISMATPRDDSACSVICQIWKAFAELSARERDARDISLRRQMALTFPELGDVTGLLFDETLILPIMFHGEWLRFFAQAVFPKTGRQFPTENCRRLVAQYRFSAERFANFLSGA